MHILYSLYIPLPIVIIIHVVCFLVVLVVAAAWQLIWMWLCISLKVCVHRCMWMRVSVCELYVWIHMYVNDFYEKRFVSKSPLSLLLTFCFLFSFFVHLFCFSVVVFSWFLFPVSCYCVYVPSLYFFFFVGCFVSSMVFRLCTCCFLFAAVLYQRDPSLPPSLSLFVFIPPIHPFVFGPSIFFFSPSVFLCLYLKGEFVMRMDADDVCLPGRIDAQVLK